MPYFHPPYVDIAGIVIKLSDGRTFIAEIEEPEMIEYTVDRSHETDLFNEKIFETPQVDITLILRNVKSYQIRWINPDDTEPTTQKQIETHDRTENSERIGLL